MAFIFEANNIIEKSLEDISTFLLNLIEFAQLHKNT